jgi:hypothetical protein
MLEIGMPCIMAISFISIYRLSDVLLLSCCCARIVAMLRYDISHGA